MPNSSVRPHNTLGLSQQRFCKVRSSWEFELWKSRFTRAGGRSTLSVQCGHERSCWHHQCIWMSSTTYSKHNTCPSEVYTSRVSKHPWTTGQSDRGCTRGTVHENTSADKNADWERLNILMLQNKTLSPSAGRRVRSMICSMINHINEGENDFDIDENVVDWCSKLIKDLSTLFH